MNDFYKEFLKKTGLALDEVPNLVLLGNSALEEKTIFTNFKNGLQVCEDLEKTLSKIRAITGVGRGLAAPQIASKERCFVTFVNDEFQYYIDPQIISYSENKNWYRESCLSCGGSLFCNLERSDAIKISFLNKEGVRQEKSFETFMARLIQHEYDHLEGIVNVRKTDPKNISLVTSDPLLETLRNSEE